MKKKTIYVCSSCSYESAGYMGKCPECDSWGTLEENNVITKKSTSSKEILIRKNTKRLNEVISGT